MLDKQKIPQRARFLVVSKQPDGMLYLSNSAIAVQQPPADRLFQVVLRFDPRRKHHHPDDNDLCLTCLPQLYEQLTEGEHGMGTWEGKTLLEFLPCD